MPEERTYDVSAVYTISRHLGTVKANSEEEALEKAGEEFGCADDVTLCHKCAVGLESEPVFYKHEVSEQ